MVLSINNNISAMIAQRHLSRSDHALGASLNRLSSGLRLNKAADDASGMVIADSLRSQGLGLGQAIKNANDAISMVQVTDGSLEESIQIIHTIKQKAIQAAQDAQTTDSRIAIQADISKLLEELDMIAKTTSFNNQKLLSGSFTNKRFQIGANIGETVQLSIPSAQSTKLGHLVNGKLSLEGQEPGAVEISIFSYLTNEYFLLPPQEVAYNNSRQQGLAVLADSINMMNDRVGVSADIHVESSTNLNIAQGETDEDFAINGVNIGSQEVSRNDSDGSLVKAINNKSAEHGVLASVNSAGILTLKSMDNRPIQVASNVGSGIGTDAVLQGEDLSTFGFIQLKQSGANQLLVNDVGGGAVVALSSDLELDGDTKTTLDSTLSAGSLLTKQSELKSGWVSDQTLTGTSFTNDIAIDKLTYLGVGSKLGIGSHLVTQDALGGDAIVGQTKATVGDSFVTAGSTLATGSVLGIGTVLTIGQDIPAGTAFKGSADIAATLPTTADSTITAGSIMKTGSLFASGTVLGNSITVGQIGPTNANSTLTAGSILWNGSSFASGTVLGSPITVNQIGPTNGNSTLTAGSTIVAGSVFSAGTVATENITIDGVTPTTGASTIENGSILRATSTLASGTVLTGLATVNAINPTNGNATIANGSTLLTGSVIASGTTMTGDATINALGPTNGLATIINGSSLLTGSEIAAATVLTGNATVNVVNPTTGNATIANGSTLETGSVIGSGTVLTGVATINAVGPTNGNSILTNGSQLVAGTILAVGTVIPVGQTPLNITVGGPLNPGDVVGPAQAVLVGPGLQTIDGAPFTLLTNSTIENTSTLAIGSQVINDKITLSSPLNVGADMTIPTGSVIAQNSTMTTGSHVDGDNVTLAFNMSLTADMALGAGSSLTANSILISGSQVNSDAITLAQNLNTGADMTLISGSQIAANSLLASTSQVNADPITLAVDMNVGGAMTLLTNSNIAANSLLATGSHVDADSITLAVNLNSTIDLVLGAGSTIANTSNLNTGSHIDGDPLIIGANFNVGVDMVLASGSTIANNSVLNTGSHLDGDQIVLGSDLAISQNMTLTTGSSVGQGSTIQYGTVLWADATLLTGLTLGEKMTLGSDLSLSSDMTLTSESVLAADTSLKKGSLVGADLTLKSAMSLDDPMTLQNRSIIANNSGTQILSDTTVGGDAELAVDLTLQKAMALSAETLIADGSALKNGSTLGGMITLADQEVVIAGKDMNLAPGSILAPGSLLTEGTYLTNRVTGDDGKIYKAGIILEENITTVGTTNITNEMTLQGGSILARGSILAANVSEDSAVTTFSDTEMNRLSDLSVLTQEGAQVAISVADTALKDLNKIRAELGSVQNQLMSTVSNIATMQVNVFSAESLIRDIDFAEETSIFSKMQILNQAGAFAMSQANLSSQNLLDLVA